MVSNNVILESRIITVVYTDKSVKLNEITKDVNKNSTLIKTNNIFLEEEKSLINCILKYRTWSFIERYKKHVYVDHCPNFVKNHNIFQKKWKNKSGIYKITFLPCRLFTYYGSSNNIGRRIKYHYYNTGKQHTFLGNFVKLFGWSAFSVTLIEECNIDKLQEREDWYLNKFKPLLNYMTKSYSDIRKIKKMSILTKWKISNSLKGKVHSLEAKKGMSLSRSGKNNYYYGKRLDSRTLSAAQKVKGKLIYVYSEKNKYLINNAPFISMRETAKYLPINPGTLKRKLDTGIPFKGYYYYSILVIEK